MFFRELHMSQVEVEIKLKCQSLFEMGAQLFQLRQWGERLFKYGVITCLLSVLLTTTACESGDESVDPDSNDDHSTASSEKTSEGASDAMPPSTASPAIKGKPLEILYISERQYDGAPAIAIIVSHPLDSRESYDEHIQVIYGDDEVKAGETVTGSWVVSDDKLTLYFPYIQPEAQYKVVVSDSLQAPDSKPLGKTKIESLTTRALVPIVSFASQGLILPRDLSDGLPVTSVNVPGVNVDYFRIAPDNLQAAFGYDYTRNTTTDQYDLNDLTKRFGELAYSGFYEIPAKQNQRVTVNLPIYEIEALQKPGLYIAVMRQPGVYDYQLKTAYFFISDIGLHIRKYAGQADIYASSLATGKPLPNIEITAWMGEKKDQPLGITSADGHLRLTGKKLNQLSDAYLIVGKGSSADGDNISAVPMNRAGLDLSGFDLGDRAYQPEEYFLYSPRDIYRPGETVTIAGLKRNADGKAVANTPVNINVVGADGQSALSRTLRPNDLNYFEVSFPVSTDAQTGTWSLHVVNPDRSKGPLATYEFKVEDFLPERMKLELKTEADVLDTSDTVLIDVNGMYLYGAPAAGNELKAKYVVRRQAEAAPALPGFRFGDEKEYFRHYEEIEGDSLDDEGNGRIIIGSHWEHMQSPVEVKVMAELYESGGRPVVRMISQRVWPLDELPGVRPLFKDDRVDSFDSAEFEIGVANAAGELVAANDVEVQVIREDRNYYWSFTPGRGWDYEYTEEEYPIYSDMVTLAAGDVHKLQVPTQWGNYRIEVKRTDVRPNQQLLTSYRYYAGWGGWGEQEARTAKPDAVALTLDKPAYSAGDKAKLTINSPHAGSALVLVESNKLLWQTRLNVVAGENQLEIPVSRAWQRHDIHVSAVVFRPGDRQDAITPNRAMGLLHLPLDRSKRQLDVRLSAPARIEPETTLTTRLNIPNAANKTAQVTLAAVDVGVLSLTNFETPDPFEFFFGRRRYQVDLKDMYNLVIESKAGERAKLSFGGDADLTAGGDALKSEVKIVAMYSGTVALDANGQADVDFAIPDFNGRVRLMAIAFTEDAVGSAEQDVTIAAPLVAELSTPRFMAAGDTSTFAVDVHNLSGSDGDFDVQLTGGDYLFVDQASRKVSLKNQEKQVLKFTVTAADAFGKSAVQLSVTDGATINLKRQWKVAVRPAFPGYTRSWRQALQPGESWTLPASEVATLMPSTARGNIVVSDLPPIDVQSALDGLLQYPYGCLEQTTSRLAPLLYADQQARTRYKLALTEAERQEYIQKGIARIESFQKPSGGFGYWNSTANEYPWATIYATDHLLRAKEQGFAVSDEVLAQAVDRLEYYFKQTRANTSNNYADSEHASFSHRAYAAFVLARLNRAELSTLRALYNNHADKSLSVLPLVHMGVALKLAGANREAQEAIDKAMALANQRQRNQWYGDYGTTVRDLALTVALLNKHGYDTQAYYKTLELADQLQGKRWYSTQERYALFMAGLSFAQRQGTQWQASMTYGDVNAGGSSSPLQASGRQQFGLRYDKLKDGVTLSNTGSQPIYVAGMLNGYNQSAPDMKTTPINIRRRYYRPDGSEILTLDTLQSGDLVLVELIISADQYYRNMLIADLLPAGLELENQNLDNAVKVDDIQIDGESLRNWWYDNQPEYVEYLDDRFVASLSVDGYERRTYYLARAVTPGTYTVPPPYAEDMYFADQYGIGATPGKLIVK